MNAVSKSDRFQPGDSCDSALEKGLRLQKAGRLSEAEQIYQDLLRGNPQHAKAWHYAGVVAYQQGNHSEAIERISRAIAIRGDDASFHCNLGLAYRAVNRIDEAVESFERSLKFRPDNAVAFNNLGVIKLERGEAEDAAFCFRQSSQLTEGSPETRVGLGKALRAQGKLEQAIEQFELALREDPKHVDAQLGLGRTWLDQMELEKAVACFRQVIELQPDHAEACNYLGSTLTSLEDYEEAERWLRRAIELDPNNGAALSNLGVALMEQRRLDEAEKAFAAANAASPDLANSLANLGALYLHQGRYTESIAMLRRALVIKPDHVDAHWNRSLSYLTVGDFEQGWAEYEWRRLRRATRQVNIPKPLWDGGSLGSRRLLLHAEQGLGDTIQFVRYAKQIKSTHPNAQIILACQKPLVPLLSRCEFLDEVYEQSKDQPLRFHLHAPLMSLPAILGSNDEESIPNEVPYLKVDQPLIEAWSGKLERIQAVKVGIVWQGNKKFASDRERSIPLEHFAHLARLDGVELISLQKGHGVEQIESKRTPWKDDRLSCEEIETGSTSEPWRLVTIEGLDEPSPPFMETAALIRNLDLVIACDTAIGHLAGALGMPVWTALPLVADWRWQTGRGDSPWYPTMQLFRQKTRGDWREVFETQLAPGLKKLAKT